MADYIKNNVDSKLDWALSFQRTGKFPLDRTDLFDSYADAVKYAAGNKEDPDTRGLCGTSYVGQIIAVVENNTVNVYKIAANRTLQQIGSGGVSSYDDVSITVNDAQELTIKGFSEAADGLMPEKKDGVITWVEPISRDGMDRAIQQASNYAAEAGIAAAVAQAEAADINGKFWFGTLEEYNALPASEIRADGIYVIQDGFY